MRLSFLVWAGVWRKPTRTIFTVASLAVGFLLFGLLQGVDAAFDRAVQRMRADRLLTDPRFGGQQPLPRSHVSQIERVPGVTQVTWTQFLFGFYQEPRNGVLVIAADAKSFFSVRPEYETSPEHLQALLDKRTGLIVLESLAATHGWKIGDQIALGSQVPRKDGTSAWTFDVVGFMDYPDNPGQVPFAVANYEYFDEARASGAGTVGRFVLRVDDPRRSVDVGNAIDALFVSSAAPTRTRLENEIAQSSLTTIGDVGRVTAAVIGAVFFAILFLASNVVLQSVRERTAELAVLKTLGFADWTMFALVVLEALFLCLCGAVLGLVLTEALFPLVSAYMPNVNAYLGTPELSGYVYLSGCGSAVALTALAAALPAWRAKRLQIVDALRADA
jgi:putative ABC transport system permease protein